jgi:dihydroorotate dehydrogenase electron transfer subunit
MIVGAGTSDRLFNVIEAKRMSASVAFTTDDGSAGTQGTVVDVLPEMARDSKTGAVYACGPMPMLRSVALACQQLDIPCQVAVEEHMACGTGVCWTCVVPIRAKDARIRMRRSCLDGPVFNGAKVAWEHTRWEPSPERDELTPTPEAADG